MSREVRRVPVGWRHPTEPNPCWESQIASRLYRDCGLPTLHKPEERFVPLLDDYPGALARARQERADIEARRGWDWDFNVRYHLTGCQGPADAEPRVHPFCVDDNEHRPVTVRDEDHLQELLLAEWSEPDPAHYMPVFDVPEGELGWCLYETVSEGSPVTPVFATAEELIEHLATEGIDWDHKPYRREAAEALVRSGHSMGSFVVAGGQMLDGARDFDRLKGGAS